MPSVQLAIRLLIPAGSKLLDLEEIRFLAGPFDPEALVHPWRHPDDQVDRLQREVEGCVRDLSVRGARRREIFESVWNLAHASGAGVAPDALPLPIATLELRHPPIPFLDEPWYC